MYILIALNTQLFFIACDFILFYLLCFVIAIYMYSVSKKLMHSIT